MKQKRLTIKVEIDESEAPDIWKTVKSYNRSCEFSHDMIKNSQSIPGIVAESLSRVFGYLLIEYNSIIKDIENGR